MKQFKPSAHPPPENIEKRLRRIESRLVQLMIHLGLDPYGKVYSGDEPELKRADTKDKMHGDS
jgi:hypothetical protein